MKAYDEDKKMIRFCSKLNLYTLEKQMIASEIEDNDIYIGLNILMI